MNNKKSRPKKIYWTHTVKKVKDLYMVASREKV
jgi:hypothetical protein